MTSFSVSLKKLTDLLPQSRDSSYYVSRLILAPLQLSLQKHIDITHKTSRTLPICDISVGSLTLPALEAGEFVELILLYMYKRVINIMRVSTHNVQMVYKTYVDMTKLK